MSGVPPSVLVLEDNPTALKMFRVALEAEGYRVIEAYDGRTVLEILARSPPDLLLQDLVVPDVDGLELVRAIRALPAGADLPIIAMSGFPRLLEQACAEPGRFDASLVKPILPSVLVETVRRYLPSPLPASGDLGRGRTILVVDDDPGQLKLVRLRLLGEGFAVLTAPDAPAALVQATEHTPDVVLCDVLMPGTDGYELCLALRRIPALAGVPVVLASAHHGGARDEELARSVGAIAFVLRTPDLSGVLEALRAVLLGRAAAAHPEPQLPRLQHAERVIAQLRRQAREHDDAAGRSALQAAQLAILAGVADALARSEDVEAAFGDVLAACLDAGGVSRAALYRRDALGKLVRTQAMGFEDGGEQLDRSASLAALLGHVAAGEIVSAGAGLGAELARDLFGGAPVRAAVLVPLLADRHPSGALLLGSDTAEMGERDLLSFGRGIAAHLAQAIALTGAFARLRAAAEANAVLYRAAQEANRAKDEFLATVSHELRTPLTAILAWGRLLENGLAEPKRQRAIEAIVRNARAQTQLVEDLLDTSQIVAGKMRLEIRPTELGPVLDAALDAVRPAMEGKRIRLSPAAEGGQVQVLADPQRLQQIFWNLLSNGVKFTPAGGQIAIAVSALGSEVAISIADDGEGIEPQFLPYVFERFKQADVASTRTHGGLGLGLAITRHLVELHGGTIEVGSEGKGRGATFTLRLPGGCLPESEAFAQTSPPSPPLPPSSPLPGAPG